MEFKNNGNDMKVRIDESGEHHWITVKTGQTVDIPEVIGFRNNFEKVKEVEEVEEIEEVEEVKPVKLTKKKYAKKSTKK